MTNYNDGKWHGWNGGECPVHPKTIVEVVYVDDGKPILDTSAYAANCDFNSVHLPIIAFRVVKEHREPREWWLCFRDGYDPIVSDVWPAAGGFDEVVLVKEKME